MFNCPLSDLQDVNHHDLNLSEDAVHRNFAHSKFPKSFDEMLPAVNHASSVNVCPPPPQKKNPDALL